MSSAKTKARQCAVQALYQWQMTGQNLKVIERQFFEDDRLRNAQKNYFIDVFHGVPKHLDKIDEAFKDSEMLNLADLTRRPAKFSYSDGDEYVFMDNEDYTSYSFNKESIEDELQFINEDTDGILVLIVDEVPVALDLPANVDLVVVETDPALKGGSATARTKPAILTTGLTVQVPEHIATGERITISVEERKFVSRADK